jgi:uncharacterized protein YndB with AHSA1/START domain
MTGDSRPATPDTVLVRQTVQVALPPEQAFRLFTDGIAQWWPLEEGYSYGGDRAREIYLEPTVGGRFYERFLDGDEFQVGTVTACSPPNLIVFTWRSPEWPAHTEVEVSFHPETTGTTVELEHRGFDRLGPDGPELARRWGGGWPRVMACFAAHTTR